MPILAVDTNIGPSGAPQYIIDLASPENNVNWRSKIDAMGYVSGPYYTTLTIPDGVAIGHIDTGDLDDAIDAHLIMDNTAPSTAACRGQGGPGGASKSAGQNGTTALKARSFIRVSNNILTGGAGGGGGGGVTETGCGTCRGAGGLGGEGIPQGTDHPDTATSAPPCPGSPDPDGPPDPPTPGCTGHGAGARATHGTDGNAGSGPGAGSGGSKGAYIDGNNFVTWEVAGTRLGSVIP